MSTPERSSNGPTRQQGHETPKNRVWPKVLAFGTAATVAALALLTPQGRNAKAAVGNGLDKVGSSVGNLFAGNDDDPYCAPIKDRLTPSGEIAVVDTDANLRDKRKGGKVIRQLGERRGLDDRGAEVLSNVPQTADNVYCLPGKGFLYMDALEAQGAAVVMKPGTNTTLPKNPDGKMTNINASEAKRFGLDTDT